MASKQFKKMMARKMLSYKAPHCHGRVTSKEGAKEWFKAKVDKKELPHNTKRIPPKVKKDPKYANLSIKQFEKKYPWK